MIRLADWTAQASAHAARVAPLADAFVDRRSRGTKHPVHDFLFTYYNFSPAKLKQWMPPLGSTLEASDPALDAHPWLRTPWFKREDKAIALDPSLIDEQVLRMASFVRQLAERILQRPPRLRCFGLHEWAMVYHLTEDQVRHNGWQLRMQPDALASFVESQTLCCSHYDAFRFFTPDSRPLNTLQPTLETRLENEQGACLHANMDLYKWATKLWPWCGSDLIADAFCLALEGRDLDMRASPYELRALGYEPVCIETEDGRRQYQVEQQQLADKAIPVRQRLIAACDAILSHRCVNA